MNATKKRTNKQHEQKHDGMLVSFSRTTTAAKQTAKRLSSFNKSTTTNRSYLSVGIRNRWFFKRRRGRRNLRRYVRRNGDRTPFCPGGFSHGVTQDSDGRRR